MTSPAPRELLIIEALRADGRLSEEHFQVAMGVKQALYVVPPGMTEAQYKAVDMIISENRMKPSAHRIDVLRDALDIIGRKV